MLNNLFLSFFMVCFSSSTFAAASVTSKHAGSLRHISGDTIHEISINPLRKTLTIVANARAYKFIGLDEIEAKKLAERILKGKSETTVDLSKYSLTSY
ncbi:hypothetical protein [Enterovibrio nigricans]|uniref:Uncharacterized protein n=1 Tax=Enterovibrio nigricans DSM 22720 TaxID=1121868 RepID=A0A1T4VC90_9GAMM|nr:hypothetical protein [Enterovibrio nigricans]SKA62599.1 hypothetical protein SAMN02745132_03641 [Enterovibrio nigricans DSM 22720]